MWFRPSSADVARRLGVDPVVGLSSESVQQLRDVFGPNELAEPPRRPPWKRFLDQFRNLLVYILLGAAVLSAAVGDMKDPIVILCVLLLNGVLGYIQEHRADDALDALRRMLELIVRVRRNGQVVEVPAAELVPGDIVLLEAGDRIPADGRFLVAASLSIDESTLTGESVPVDKDDRPIAGTGDVALAERRNIGHMNTTVVRGRAEMAVTATGMSTVIGQLAGVLGATETQQTPLQEQLDRLGKRLALIAGVAVALVFAVGLAQGDTLSEAILGAVALAVAAIPEGLPAVVTVTLAIGVSRMAKHNAIVKRLASVETLGSTTVICSDKTGTLTLNQMTATTVASLGQMFEVTGLGYGSDGEVHLAGSPLDEASMAALRSALVAGVLCNDAHLTTDDSGAPAIVGDPTEAALVVLAAKAGVDTEQTRSDAERVDEVPFDSEAKFMATLHPSPHRSDSSSLVVVKGAPDVVLARCAALATADGLVTIDEPLRAQINEVNTGLGAQGLRVLAIATRELPVSVGSYSGELADEVGELSLQMLVGILDPARPEAVKAIAQCHQAGIAVKMSTGDHMRTAKAIAAQIGLESGADVVALTGRDLEKLTGDELAAAAERTSVFARVAPEQKLRLVQALQARGHIVAMTGDGVNDAPALKQADIGIAMGITGTDVSKEAADMILTDDNFASIEAAVEEGRGIFDNLTKFILWILPTSAGVALILLVAILAGITLPMLPTQVLWINLVTALFLGLTLVFEPKERDIMKRPPRDPKRPLLTFQLFMRTGLVTLISLAGGFGLFLWECGMEGTHLDEARTAVVNVIVMVQSFYLLNCRSRMRSPFSIGLFSNCWLLAGLAATWLVQLAFTYEPLMNRLFHTTPIRAEAWLYIVGIGVFAFAAVELEKWLRFRAPQPAKNHD